MMKKPGALKIKSGSRREKGIAWVKGAEGFAQDATKLHRIWVLQITRRMRSLTECNSMLGGVG